MDHSVEALKPDCEIEGASGAAVTEVSAVNSPFILATNPPPETIILTEPPPEVAEWATRTLDIIVAGLLLVMVGPLMAICALATWLSGPGPLIFRQARIGRNGVEFTCLKFRPMVCNADSAIEELLRKSGAARQQWQALQKLHPDPRVTHVGRFMRRYCLDELPQLFNILAGQMSVVGPRPIVAAEIDRYGPQFADYCAVRPGLTGLWQISGRHALSYEERVRLDSEYARSKSVATDIAILWRTVPIVLAGLNE